MKKIIAIAVLSFLTFEGFSQTGCPGCMVDTVNIGPVTHPAGGTYPDTLPPATAYQPYSEDMTFFIPLTYQHPTFGTVEVLGLKIKQVIGLPFGLSWECSTPQNGCFYDPKSNPPSSQYGCVKICGTPIANPGLYPVTVVVDGTGKAVGQTQTQEDYYYSAITVLPNTSGTATFNYSPDSGCDSVSVNFSGLISPTANNPVNYYWDFDNGNTDAGQSPPVVSYDTAGIYHPVLTTEILNYVASEVNLSGTNQNWCGDIEEPNVPLIGCQGAPDPYFVLTDANSNIIHTSPAKSNTSNTSWTGLTGLVLNDPPFSISFYDEDGTSNDDLLGTFSFNVTDTGLVIFGSGSGTSGSLVVSTEVNQSFTDTGEVVVVARPPFPYINIMPHDTVCEGDSITLSIYDGPYQFQWSNDTAFLSNATDSFYRVGVTDSFSVMITDTNGCTTFSDTLQVVVDELPPKPAFIFPAPNVLQTTLTGYQFVWYQDGNVIPGQNTSILQISESGNYQVEAFTDFGCSTISNSLFYVYQSVNENHLQIGIEIYPNPGSGIFNIDLLAHKQYENLELEIQNLLGEVVYNKNIPFVDQTSSALTVDIRGMSGFYLIRVSHEDGQVVRKVVVR